MGKKERSGEISADGQEPRGTMKNCNKCQCGWVEIRALSPGNHLLLFVGGVTSTAQDLCRCGQEVKAVVFEILVNERHQDLREEPEMLVF